MRSTGIGIRLALSSCPATFVLSSVLLGGRAPPPARWGLVGIAGAWLCIEALIGATQHFRGEVPRRGWVSLSRGLWLLGPWLCWLDARRIGATVSAPAVLALLALLAFGLAIRATALLQLGRGFSYDVSVGDAEVLLTGGAFRWIRHPAYLGLLILCVLPGTLIGSVLGTAFLAATSVPQVIHRIVWEEVLLERRFGEAYARYRASTSRLIPFVY
jgi:protein-S-isoprenylcysteine O-methyltransferase Ste14